MNELKIERKDGRAYITTPYHPEFIWKIKMIEDHWWHPDTRQWSIPDNEGVIQAAREAMKESFGHDDQSVAETVNVEVTFNEYFIQGPSVMVLGKPIFRTRGKESRIITGDSVYLLKGGVVNESSNKYPTVGVKVGTIVRIDDVLPSEIDKYKEQTDKPYTVEVLNLDTDEKKLKLENEKEKLLARIDEIDRELAKLGVNNHD